MDRVKFVVEIDDDDVEKIGKICDSILEVCDDLIIEEDLHEN